MRRATTHDSHVLSGGLARLVRRRDIPGGQGRESQRHVPERRDSRQAPPRPQGSPRPLLGPRPPHPGMPVQALTPEAGHPQDLVVSRLGLGGHLAELCDGSGQIALHRCAPEVKAT